MRLLILMSLNTIYSAGSTFLLPLLFFLNTQSALFGKRYSQTLKFIKKPFFYHLKCAALAPVLEIKYLFQTRFLCMFGFITYEIS